MPSATTDFTLEVRNSNAHGRGLFLTAGTLQPGEEVAAFSGVPINSRSNKQFFTENGASYMPNPDGKSRLEQLGAKEFVERAMVGIHTTGGLVGGLIVHRPLFALAAGVLQDHPTLRLRDLMGKVPKQAIIEHGGQWYLINNARSPAEANVKMSVQHVNGEKRLVWTTTSIISCDAGRPVELLYCYDTVTRACGPLTDSDSDGEVDDDDAGLDPDMEDVDAASWFALAEDAADAHASTAIQDAEGGSAASSGNGSEAAASTVFSSQTVTSDLESLSEEALEKILEGALPLLNEIHSGKVTWSHRHGVFHDGARQRHTLLQQPVQSLLDDDQQVTIIDFLRDHFAVPGRRKALHTLRSERDYVSGSLWPDFLVYLVMQRFDCTLQAACDFVDRRTTDLQCNFVSKTTHDTLVAHAIHVGEYIPATFNSAAPPPPDDEANSKYRPLDVSTCLTTAPPASTATGSAFVSLAAAVAHMSASPCEDSDELTWAADVRIGTTAFLASPFVGNPQIGHSPHVSALESVAAMGNFKSTNLPTEMKVRAAVIRDSCKLLEQVPHVQVDLSVHAKAQEGTKFVRDLLAGAMRCMKGDAADAPATGDGGSLGAEFDHVLGLLQSPEEKEDDAAASAATRAALLVTHGTSTYAVLVHPRGQVSFRDPHSVHQLNFRSVRNFLSWVGQQQAFEGSVAFPTTYFRYNPLWPATSLFGIAIIPRNAKRTKFDIDAVYAKCSINWLPPALAEPPVVASGIGIGGSSASDTADSEGGGGGAVASPGNADGWLHRCLFWNMGSLSGGWTEGSVTRAFKGDVCITMKPKLLTASLELKELKVTTSEFQQAFGDKLARWATALSPRELFIKSNSERSPCQFCGQAMTWFPKAKAKKSHQVCSNFREIAFAAVLHGKRSRSCTGVFDTCKDHPGKVFGCAKCPNDVGPVGPAKGPFPKAGTGLGRCHLLCAGCQKHAAKGLQGEPQQVLRPSGEHFWQVEAQPSRSRRSLPRLAVNAVTVTQWLSPGSAERLVDEANRLCRLNEELTQAEVGEELHKEEALGTNKPVSHLTLKRRSRGGTIFNYRMGDLVFGCEGVPKEKAVPAMLLADFPFPTDSYNLRQQYEVSPDGNNGFTCSAQDMPFLAIARKYEQCCFLRAMRSPDSAGLQPLIVGSKILRSGRETFVGDKDPDLNVTPFETKTVRCNSGGGFGVERRGPLAQAAEGVRFDETSGCFETTVRRFQTHQQLYHTDATQKQTDYTIKTGHHFWSCVGSLSPKTMLNLNGFNSYLTSGLCAAQTGTNPHAGSFGYQAPRTHTYIDFAFEDPCDNILHTGHDSNTTFLGLWFDSKHNFHYSIFPFDTDPNAEER
jgi:hypothetical protein